MRPPLTFGRVLSLGKWQTSLPLLSLLQNLRSCKKNRILTHVCAYINKGGDASSANCVCVCVCVFIQIFETAKHLRRKLRRINIVYDMSVSVVHEYYNISKREQYRGSHAAKVNKKIQLSYVFPVKCAKSWRRCVVLSSSPA